MKGGKAHAGGLVNVEEDSVALAMHRDSIVGRVADELRIVGTDEEALRCSASA
jgi:hypothetical protein